MTTPSGIPVTLSGAATGRTTTNASGTYGFLALSNGTYTVTAGQPALIVIVYNKDPKTATISGANLTVNFSGSVCTKCTSGTVALTDGTPVAGVSVSASNASATTDETGLYILQPPGNGNGQGSQQGVEGTIVPSMPGYAFTPGNRPCDSRHLTHQDFTAVTQGQGSVKEGAGLTGGSGEPGAGRPQAGNPPTRHPEASSEASPLKDLGQGPSSAGRGQTASSSYGVRPHGGPGPSPFGRGEACDGMDEGEAAGMEAEAAPTTAVRTEAATLTNTATYFYVWDQVGSVRLVMDGAGNLVTLHDYEPYGVEILPNTPTSMPTDALAGTHLYTGQERDADTGLDNFHFRSYASTMGRFLSPDNMGGTPLNPQSFNLYAYVHGNPVNYNDPTGHWMAGLPPQRYYNSDPFGGLNFPPTEGSLEPTSVVDALINSANGNQSTRSATQPGAQEEQQKSSPTAGQEGTKLGGTIYNETGSLRPSLNKKGKTDSTSQTDLHDARKAIGQVVLNIQASGKTPDVAKSTVSASGKRTSQYADSLSAAKEAIKAGGDKAGPKHFYIRSGALTIQNGVVTGGDQPSWGKGVVPTASYGPFRNPVKAGDVAAGNSVYVDIYNVP